MKGGVCTGAPDVCKTPPLATPVPYTNTADPSGAVDPADLVLIENKPTLNAASSIPSSVGDQAGAMGGVVSGTVGARTTFKSYSAKVYAQGKRVVRLGSTTAQNSGNVPAGAQAAPSQTKVFVAD